MFLSFRKVICASTNLWSDPDINAACVTDSWKMFMRVCTLLMCLLTHMLLGLLCCCFIVCIKVFVRTMFVTEDETYFYHRNDLTQLELRLMCLAFFRALTLCVCVCVFFFFFFCQGEEHRWLEPAATPVGLKFACFPPMCIPQPNHRQHCMLVCSWCFSQCQLSSLPMCQIGCDV